MSHPLDVELRAQERGVPNICHPQNDHGVKRVILSRERVMCWAFGKVCHIYIV